MKLSIIVSCIFLLVHLLFLCELLSGNYAPTDSVARIKRCFNPSVCLLGQKRSVVGI